MAVKEQEINRAYENIRIEKDNIPDHDVLIGGFPCQPFSTLGKLKGFEDEERIHVGEHY